MRVYFFKSTTFCYNSKEFFVGSFMRELSSLGVKCSLIEPMQSMSAEDDSVLIDFNSVLPRQEGFAPGRPFYNYILDHPLYHHRSLNISLPDYHVICIDNNHAKYVRENYPHIKSVSVLPLAGIPGTGFKHTVFYNRPYDLSFCATYTSPDMVMDSINSLNDPTYIREIKDYIDALLWNPGMTLEEIFRRKHGEAMNPSLMGIAMHAMMPVDMYVTATYRTRIISALVNAGINVDVFGYKWELHPMYGAPNLRVHDDVPYPESAGIAADSRFYLNIQPWFKDGIHDRVFTAILNDSIALTDSSVMIEKDFTDGENIVLYDLANPEGIADVYLAKATDTVLAMNIAHNGLMLASKAHTYACRAKALIELLEASCAR